MERNFKHVEAPKAEPIYFEQIFAETSGGGLAANPAFDIEKTTAVYKGENGLYLPIKAYRLVEAVKDDDTTIKIAKGSGVKKGDFIGHGTKAVAATAVSTTSEDYDLVTVTLGVAIKADVVLFQAAEASDDAAKPLHKPEFILGTWVKAGDGDQEVRLINGANLRKETAHIAPEVVELLPMITLV